ncbi:MAG TPA: SO_0444 family Cu/Zn efflux transporter [Planctomycetes bacterium]|nr:SO_0444 family Cu/Zn efflux transporter [Planctomycetota bacterium]HIJ70773.1 SO_0444 family Cu/Zn efflux transporter [Planctomycetota bacterium]
MTQILEIFIKGFWETLAEMSPYLLFGFFVAGVLSVFISARLVERHLGGRGIWPLLKASAFGVPLPLCSCGVIPVSMSLRKHGASKGSTISFLLSTPQTGVDSIFVTFSLLGPVFAIFRPVAALITGVIGGGLVQLTDPEPADAIQPECTDACCNEKEQKSKIIRALKHGFVTLPADIGKAMFIGLIVAAVISAAIPDDFFAPFLGGGILAMLIMMALGIPVYVCATASVPVAAALITKGVNPGAAMVFLMTGPATNAAAFMTIWSVLGKKTAITYIITVAGAAIAAGLLLDRIVRQVGSDNVFKMGWMLPPIVKYASAVVLLAVLIFAMVGTGKTTQTEGEKDEKDGA